MSARSLLVLVRSAADLPRTCDELSDFLEFRRRRASVPSEVLLGFWVDRRWTENIPCQLRWREPEGQYRMARICETAGVDGIWMLCWLDVPEGSDALSRRALSTSLSAAFGPADAEAPPAFVPVFALDAPASDVQLEAQLLMTEHAGLVGAPLFQDPHNGRLETPTAVPV